jgi:hypothetical protein
LYSDLKKVGYWSSIVFLLFIMFMQIALMNVILGIFVQHATQSMEENEIEKAHSLTMESRRIEKELRAICQAADADHSGTLSLDDWRRAMRQPPMGELLFALGFRRHNLDTFVAMLAAKNGQVSVDEFVTGCMRLRGPACSSDLNEVLAELMASTASILTEMDTLKKALSAPTLSHIALHCHGQRVARS